jgi:hypothetical protein
MLTASPFLAAAPSSRGVFSSPVGAARFSRREEALDPAHQRIPPGRHGHAGPGPREAVLGRTSAAKA